MQEQIMSECSCKYLKFIISYTLLLMNEHERIIGSHTR